MPEQSGDTLTLPTDKRLIKQLSNGKRETPKNLSVILDADRTYLSNRLRDLEKLGYVSSPGPADRSGMYEITDLGRIVSYHLDKYTRSHHRIFHAGSHVILKKQPDGAFYPDLVILDEPERIALRKLDRVEGVTIPSELSIEITHDAGYAPRTAGDALYALYFHGLAERVENMDAYRITDRGEEVGELLANDIRDPVKLTESLREYYSEDERNRLTMLTKCH